jgi:hypothetical protein
MNLQLYIQWVKESIDHLPLLRFISLQHSLFEAIHSFEDGNGRTGRILSNYLLISRGFPIVTIKGDGPSREVYFCPSPTLLNKSFCGGPGGSFYKKRPLVAEG